MREVSEDQRSPINVRVFRVRGVTYRACLDGSVGAMCPCARAGTGTVDPAAASSLLQHWAVLAR